MSDLSRYAAKARTMRLAELVYALDDIRGTIALRPDLTLLDPYLRKLLDERDAYLSELHRRNTRDTRRTRLIKRAAARQGGL